MKTEFTPDAQGLMEILRILRSPEGCPWDRAQTRSTLAECFAGEAAELIDAVDRNDPEAIKEECGDVLMNLFLQILIGEERSEFDLKQVFAGINEKMVRRHRHIFGDAKAETPEEVTALWQQVKKEEHAASGITASILDSVKPSLATLARAEKMQKKAAKTGFDWSNEEQIVGKIREELAEVEEALRKNEQDSADEELGDLMFSVINLIRFRHRISAEETLRKATLKFETRFRYVESGLARQGKTLEEATLDEMEALWCQAKKAAPVQR